MACEQGDQERIWALVEIISTGKMPDGHTADELRALGLPLPGELYREEQPDGTVLIRQHPPQKIDALRKAAADNNNAFVCDAPIDD
jgi:hypothetical protein